MALVLGIDAAWSAKNPSGVALVATGIDRPRLIRAAPSYDHFVRNTWPEDWGEQLVPRISLAELLIEAQRIGGENVTVIAVDMPVAFTPVRRRRHCDTAISTKFGGNGCSTHSPTNDRPGAISDTFLQEAESAGFSLRVAGSNTTSPNALLEVYPHVALLALCNSQYRLQYKLSRRRTYWPDRSAEEGREEIKREWNRILSCLKTKINLNLEINCTGRSQRRWKAWEDVIDAIVCCWVGLEWLTGRAVAYGDRDAAIWVPVKESRDDVV